jgi:roadblock/LC7 domain-containing protein
MATQKKTAKLSKAVMAAMLAQAMNLLNDVDRDDWTDQQLGLWHELADLMPEHIDYMNNGTVMSKDLL